MKKILALSIAFIAALSLMSCNDDKGNDPLLQAKPETLTFGPDAEESQDVYVLSSSGVNWEAEVEASAQAWLKITTGAGKISVSVEKNTTDAGRTGKIIFKPDTNALQPIEVTVSQATARVVNIDAAKAWLEFWDDYYQCGFSNYSVTMGSGDLDYDIDTGYLIVDDGYYVYLDVFTEDISPKDYQEIDLKEGTYKSSMDTYDENFEFEKMSFIITRVEEGPGTIQCAYSIVARYEGGKVVERFLITGGEVTVKNDNGNYNISASLISADGEKIIINYAGEFTAKSNEVSNSTYTGDLNLSGLNTGVIQFYGNDEDYFPELYHWYVMIEIPGYDNVSEIMLGLYSPKTDPMVLDSGTYTISDSWTYEPFLAEAGWAFLDIYGCWVYKDDLTDYAPLIEGTVDVTHKSGDNYTIKVDALMDNYYAVKASFEGNLEYTDMTVEPQPMPPLKMPAAKAIPKTRVKEGLVIDKDNLLK